MPRMPRRPDSHTAGSPDPLGVGGPRSEGTRRAILDAARNLFAARGYEQTTIRAVAGRADIDASMVMRYFGSKAGLFAAAATLDLDAPNLARRFRRTFGYSMTELRAQLAYAPTVNASPTASAVDLYRQSVGDLV